MKTTYALGAPDAGSEWGLFAFDEFRDEGPVFLWQDRTAPWYTLATTSVIAMAPQWTKE